MQNANSKIILGLVQSKCTENSKENIEKSLEQIESLAKKGAQIICLQELFSSLYFCQSNDDSHFTRAESVPGTTTQILSQQAKKLGVVIVSSHFEKDGGDYFNTAAIHDTDGILLGKYRKMHIPDDLKNHYSEKYYFKDGNLGYPVFKTKFGTIGVLVCWDQWYPEAARALALQGAQIIFYPTSIGWPKNERSEEIGKNEFEAWVTIQRSHAIANGIFVAATNRTGLEDNITFWGGSFVSDPFGKILGQANHHKDESLLVECDLSRIQEIRKDWPFLECRRQ